MANKYKKGVDIHYTGIEGKSQVVKKSAIIREFKDTPFATLAYWEEKFSFNEKKEKQGIFKLKNIQL